MSQFPTQLRRVDTPVIGLDARTLSRASLRGIGVSTARLYKRLSEQRPNWRFVFYHQTALPLSDERLEGANITWKRIDVPGDRLDAWTQLRLPWQVLRDKVDLLHCPANWCPLWQPVPTIQTIHDLIPLTSQERPDGEPVVRFRLALQAARKARRVVCPSSYVAEQVAGRVPELGDRVSVIGWGGDRVAGIDPDLSQADLAPAGIGQRFALHMAAADPRKNTRRVLEAWSLLPPAVRSEFTLVLVGATGEFRRSLVRLIDRLGILKSVRLLEPVERLRLESLMRSAEVLVYPSVSEGFGLPIVEAFTRETAVLTSKVTSMPEVAGEAAELVDPRNTMAIRNGLERILTQPQYQRYLVNAGLERVAGMRWDGAAERMACVIEDVLGLGRSLSLAA
ncbi:glycosyltransferase family 4 protein [Mucisphaera calidilacus]|uniref:D-inositol 3-phosphate glycosyltransferase n=1 Tax=Mucisphaera calidilacus TaxID=2527982 RepID=A0A518BXT8_9BACT|nr:glycosyltransferase family 1 protein [Mucisphaera calidilacus]QDU71795.1 D-inositol 3-phosphate glycosyltransferase [Mucisphaera calidilacus]